MKFERRRWINLALTAVLVCALPAGAVAARPGGQKGEGGEAFSRIHGTGAAPNYDIRNTRAGRRNYAAPSAAPRAAQARLRRSLGAGGIVKIDRATGTPAWVSSRTGFLTGKGKGSARATALGFVRRHAAAFGLDRDDLAGVEVAQLYRTKRGLTHIEFVQKYKGIAAFDNGLRVNLAGGRIVNVSGSPQPDLAVASTTPKLSPVSAARRALADVGARRSVVQRSQKGSARRTVLSGRNLATLVLFVEGKRTRLAWNVIASKDGDEVYRTLVDADNGEVLKRTSLVAHASGAAFRYYPGAPAGGTQTPATFSTAGDDAWVGFGANPFTRLKGDNAHTYSDPGDTYHLSDLQCNQNGCTSNGSPPAVGDEIAPSAGSGTPAAAWIFAQATGNNGGTPGRFCPTAGCSWYAGAGGIGPTEYDAPFGPGNNWQANRRQNGTQVHFFVNNFHDFTQNDPGIAFDDASGNFEETATGENGGPAAPVGGDSLRAQVDDGASTFNADFPHDDYMNNANMLTLPERDQNGPVPFPFKAPQMQMFLFSDFACGGPCPGADINDVNGGDDAAILYHEFVHGLSNRLVDPFGVGALGTDQGGAMGEAWSDVYAMDYLNAQGLQPDTAATGEVVFGTYEGMEGQIRTQPQDCPVASNPNAPDPVCPQTNTTCCFGGYTYGQFGTIAGGPEVHADGEIWAETLWDLRQALVSGLGANDGQFAWRALVTDAMRLAPADPDVLDFLVMRDAILAANEVDGFGQANCERIWDVFARRGMGVDASSGGGADTSPAQGFADPGAAACEPPPDGGGNGGGDGGGDGGGGGGGGSANATVSLSLAGAKGSLRVARTGRFSYSFRATPGSRGSATFRSLKKVRTSARKFVTFAKRSFIASGSGRVTLKLKLSRKNLRILRRNKKVVLRVSAAVSAGGASARTARRLTLRAPTR